MENWIILKKLIESKQKNQSILDNLGKELIEAALNKDKEKAKQLLKNGANLNFHEEHVTPLIACIEVDAIDLADYFISIGAKIDYRPMGNFLDAMWYAAINKKHNFLQLFINNKVKLLRSPIDNKTLLIFATVESDVTFVEMLLKHTKININETDGNGNTALHYNMSKIEMTENDITIGKLLLAAGADVRKPNSDGKTPEDLAASREAQILAMQSKLENDLNKNKETKAQNGQPQKRKKFKV